MSTGGGWILALNGGSSSLKFAAHRAGPPHQRRHGGPDHTAPEPVTPTLLADLRGMSPFDRSTCRRRSRSWSGGIGKNAPVPLAHAYGAAFDNPGLPVACVVARIGREDLEELLYGYGYEPWFVEGDDPETVHQLLAGTIPWRRSIASLNYLLTSHVGARTTTVSPNRTRGSWTWS